MSELREQVARAMKYVVVVRPGECPSDDRYCIMEGPDCIVQIGGDITDDHIANEACGRMNIDAAITTILAALETPSEDMLTDGGRYLVMHKYMESDESREVAKWCFAAMLTKFKEQSQ